MVHWKVFGEVLLILLIKIRMKYSIITINYNNRDGLENTIKSVINQTCQDFEYIVIDGGSTDGSVDVIKKYDDRIDYWISEPDKGIYNAMNKGILQAHGEYLNFMNSGDCFYDEKVLQEVYVRLNNDMVVGRDFHFNQQTKRSHKTIFPLRLSMFTFYSSYLPHQSTFFKKNLFENAMYDESYKIVSDWKFYIQKIIDEACNVSFIDVVVAWREQDGISSGEMDLVNIEREKVLKEFLPSGINSDYQTLTKIDRGTLEKLLILCDMPRANRLLTYFIKTIYRLIKIKQWCTFMKKRLPHIFFC